MTCSTLTLPRLSVINKSIYRIKRYHKTISLNLENTSTDMTYLFHLALVLHHELLLLVHLLAEISVRSPQKVFIFTICETLFWIKVSNKYII